MAKQHKLNISNVEKNIFLLEIKKHRKSWMKKLKQS